MATRMVCSDVSAPLCKSVEICGMSRVARTLYGGAFIPSATFHAECPEGRRICSECFVPPHRKIGSTRRTRVVPCRADRVRGHVCAVRLQPRS